MLIQKSDGDGSVTILFSSLFYGINSIISACAHFEKEYSTEVSLSFFKTGKPGIYHLVRLTPKSRKNLVFDFVNYVLENECAP